MMMVMVALMRLIQLSRHVGIWHTKRLPCGVVGQGCISLLYFFVSFFSLFRIRHGVMTAAADWNGLRQGELNLYRYARGYFPILGVDARSGGGSMVSHACRVAERKKTRLKSGEDDNRWRVSSIRLVRSYHNIVIPVRSYCHPVNFLFTGFLMTLSSLALT